MNTPSDWFNVFKLDIENLNKESKIEKIQKILQNCRVAERIERYDAGNCVGQQSEEHLLLANELCEYIGLLRDYLTEI